MDIEIKPRIEKLSSKHAVESFKCDSEALNIFLHKHALTNQKAGSAQTYVALLGRAVVGYYSLTIGQVEHTRAPERLRKGLPRHPVPAMILARLGVANDKQGEGLGSGLLLDALRRTLQAADIAGIRAIVVHAKNEKAQAFYEHFGFKSFESEHLVLYRLLKDVRLMVES